MLIIGASAAGLGYHFIDWIPPFARIYQMIIVWGLLLGMIILDREPGWNLVLYLGFALAAGSVLNWSGAGVLKGRTWVIFGSLLFVSIGSGVILRKGLRGTARILLPATLLYLIGWVLILTIALAPIYNRIWIIIGLILFTLIAIKIVNREKSKPTNESIVPLVIELFVVYFNLFWLSGVL